MASRTVDEAQAARKQPSRKKIVVSVECIYAMEYQLREGFEASAKQIKAFKVDNPPCGLEAMN